VFLLAIAAFAIPASSLASTIGLYTDSDGSSCSFSGNDPGVVTAYVVVHPDGNGVRAVRFAASIPSCLGAVFLNETPFPDVGSIGTSETGISLSTSSCGLIPEALLQINYYRSGSTSACCEFSLGPDPTTGSLESVACDFSAGSITPIKSHFDANATCPCSDPIAPMPPSNPVPSDGVTHVDQWPAFSWVGQDWNNDIASYDVYLGTTTSPPLVATGLTTSAWDPPASLSVFSTYYWRVVAHDATGLQTSGPLWSFTTSQHSPPIMSIVSPALGVSNLAANGVVLKWSASDPDHDPIIFDVYFGTANPPPFVATTAQLSYPLSTLDWETTYYWRIVARDGPHSQTSTGVYSFATRNPAPLAPSNPSPANGNLTVPLSAILSWTAVDPQGEPTTCNVYFGSSEIPPLVAQGIVTGANNVASYNPGTLVGVQRYYWRITVSDPHGQVTNGSTWTFVTPGNLPPSAPANPIPSDGSTNAPLQVDLRWTDSDPEGQRLVYDVYLGTSTNPELVTNTDTTTSVFPLISNTTWYWRVVAHDPLGGVSDGPTWSFTTGPNHPPVLSVPVPPDGSSSTSTQVTLSWNAVDEDQQPLNFKVYFGYQNPPPLVGTTTARSFNAGQVVFGRQYYWQVRASDRESTTTGPLWSFYIGNPIPVLFSHFDAAIEDAGVRIKWGIASDDAIESCTVYRRLQDNQQAVALVTLPIDGDAGSYLDRTVEAGKSYRYEVMMHGRDGSDFRSPAATVQIPALELTLGANHPNPFNPQTVIPYSVPMGTVPERVRLAVYDASGRLVRVLVDEKLSAGSRTVLWRGDDADGRPVVSGVYFCVLDMGGLRRTQKMVLLK
jgi:hypothetical protein